MHNSDEKKGLVTSLKSDMFCDFEIISLKNKNTYLGPFVLVFSPL